MNFTNELYFENFPIQKTIDKHVTFMLDDDMLRLIYYTSSDSTSPPHMHVYSYKSDDIFKVILPPTLDSVLLHQLLNDPSRKGEVIDCTKHSITTLSFLNNVRRS